MSKPVRKTTGAGLSETGPIPGDGEVLCPHCGQVHPASWSHCPNTGKPIAAGPALIGRIIADRYRILGLIGEGGMGAVYEAEHLHVGRRVALKRLHPELAADANSVQRFQREARAAGRTGHENVVDVIDLGFADDGAPYLVMELLEGENLAERLRRERQLSPQRACHVVGQVLAALEAVHAHGVIHRDLKPDNIFLTRRGARRDYVKVLDFGVSKVRDLEADNASLTRTGVMVGTPHYMSPEQARGVRALDHRVDLYACGVILYEALSGQLPFRGDNYHALLQAILAGEPTRLSVIVPSLDAALVDLVHRALSRAPDERFADAGAMLDALVRFGADAREVAESVAPPAPSITDMPTTPMSASVVEPHLRASRRSDSLPASVNDSEYVSAPEERGVRKRSGVRGFEAASQDWDEAVARRKQPPLRLVAPQNPTPPRRPIAAPTPVAERVRREATPPLGTVPGELREARLPRRAPTGPATPSVKGGFLIAALESLRHRYGEARIKRALATIPKASAEILQSVLLPVTWVPLPHFHALLDAAERELGTGDGFESHWIGKSVAERELPTTHRVLLKSATPANAVTRVPQLWRAYFNHGSAWVEPKAAGDVMVHVEDGGESFFQLQAAAGFYQRLLERTGAHDVEASVESSRAQGDDGSRLSLRWR